MMTKLKVAVCIPAFSDPINIDGCVKSILESNNNHYELDILLFNNSTRQDIISLCKELSYENEEIRLFDNRTNRGCSVCWNDAIEHVFVHDQNKYAALIIVNDDTKFNNHSFIEFVDYVTKNPDQVVIKGAGYSVFGYTRLAYEKLGYFDENIYPAYFEDSDFSARIQNAGFNEIDFNVDISHIGSSSIPSNNLRRTFEEVYLPRTRAYYHKKWGNPILHDGFPIKNNYPFNRSGTGFRIPLHTRKGPYHYANLKKDIAFAYEKFDELKSTHSDINRHLDTIYKYAQKCNVGIEFGCRTGNSTFALLLGLQYLYSCDTAHLQSTYDFLNPYFGDRFIRYHGYSFDFDIIDEADLLFVDSAHTYETVSKELLLHGHKIKKYIIFHDTVSFGITGEDGGEGILKAINEFLEANPEWKIVHQVDYNNGLMIIERQ
jgi:GT2 family glycosyltransferase